MPNKTKSMFDTIAEDLLKQFPARAPDEPALKASVLNAVACQMAKIGYEMSPNMLEVLTDYLKGYNLWLCGNVGVGKTYFFECLSRYRQNEKGLPPIEKLSMIETMGWTMDNARDWVMSHNSEDVLLDDVGSEPVMNSYGVKAELFPYLLEKRMQLTAKRTHITSNLGPKDIINRYDVRVSDRFVQMFKFEEIKSPKGSRRRTRPWKTAKNGGGIL